MNKAQKTIQFVAEGKSVDEFSFWTMAMFTLMLQRGPATVADFDACGIDLMQLANRYGSANCWTGSSGTTAAILHAMVKEQRGHLSQS